MLNIKDWLDYTKLGCQIRLQQNDHTGLQLRNILQIQRKKYKRYNRRITYHENNNRRRAREWTYIYMREINCEIRHVLQQYLYRLGAILIRDFFHSVESDGKQTRTLNNININQRRFDKRKTSLLLIY